MARILLIEDNLASLELMEYLLKAFGHSVRSMCDGEAGLEAIRSERPDLVVCDIHLPKLDGYAVARQVKADAGLKSIPLLAVTALTMMGDEDRGLAAGFDGYIAKPIDPEEFIVHIENFLSTGSSPPTRTA